MHMSHESVREPRLPERMRFLVWNALYIPFLSVAGSSSRLAGLLSRFRSKWILALLERVRDVESFSIRLCWKRCWAHRELRRSGEARIHPAVCAALLMIHTCSCAHPPPSLPGDRQIAACRSRVRRKLIGRAELSVSWGLPHTYISLKEGGAITSLAFYPLFPLHFHTPTFSLSLLCQLNLCL